MSTAKLQFTVNGVNTTNPFLYLACYDSKKNYYSSNFYSTSLDSRSNSANLTVENKCYILGVYVDYHNAPYNYYAITPMYVSDVSKLPTGSIEISTKSMAGDITTTYDLSSVSNNALTIGLIKDISTYVSPISGDSDNASKSSDAITCINGGNVIIGDAAITKITRPNGAYYYNHNICVSSPVIAAYKSNYLPGTSMIVILIILLLVIVIIAIVAFVGYKMYKKHKGKV
jgi:hypothetical protein